MPLADRFDAFLIDLDGVVYVGSVQLPGAGEAVGALRVAGKEVLFLTNDARSSRAEYAERLRGLGVDASADEILTAGAATATYLRDNEELDGRTAFVIGSSALKAELQAVGLRLIEGEDGRSADLVVVSGHEGFDYGELRIAAQAVIGGARFYGTARDANFPMPDGPWPASGAILAAVETASKARAIAIGKPEPYMFTAARSLTKGERIVVIGDSATSDVAGGNRAGMATILIGQTGNAQQDLHPEDVADHVVASLLDVVEGEE